MNWFTAILAALRKPTPAPVAKSLPATVTAPATPVHAPVLVTPDWLTLCLPLTKASEGCQLHAYSDPGTGGDPWTIGWGSTGPGIVKGLVWTQDQADQRLQDDLKRFAASVDALVHVPLTGGQKAALVDFTYNLGAGNLGSSTLLKLLNSGDYSGAAEEFQKWDLAAGKVMLGLSRRRDAERTLFLSGMTT